MILSRETFQTSDDRVGGMRVVGLNEKATVSKFGYFQISEPVLASSISLVLVRMKRQVQPQLKSFRVIIKRIAE